MMGYPIYTRLKHNRLTSVIDSDKLYNRFTEPLET